MLIDDEHAARIAVAADEQAKLDQALEVLDDIDAAIEMIEGRAIDQYYADEAARAAYSPHLDIFRAGAEFRERAAMGGNRVGKTHMGAYEMTLHLTGDYPDWWPGIRFKRPITAWACGETAAQVRDVVQVKLMGTHGRHGTGMLPRASLEEVRRRQGVAEAVELVRVKHASGGTSTLQFKSYSEGRETYQGARVEFVWLDEEPSEAIYSECLLRTTQTGDHEQPGRLLMTMTPMKGLSEVAEHFLDDDGRLSESSNRFALQIGWDDVPHLTASEKADLLSSIPKHQRDARTKGYPTLGAGSVYTWSRDRVVMERPFQPPTYWRFGYGMDVGWNATAVVQAAMNPDTQDIYVLAEYKAGERTPQQHVSNFQHLTEWGGMRLSGAIDPAARGRGQRDGVQLLSEYRRLGLNVRPADNAVEAGIAKVQGLMDLCSLHISPNCRMLLAEMQRYQRDDLGRIRKQHDHLLDALRYLVMTTKVMRSPNWTQPKTITLSGERRPGLTA